MAEMGRPRIPTKDELTLEINWKLIENLCHIQCTQDEIAAATGVSVDTIDKRCREDKGQTFSEFFKEKRQGGRASLRRAQWKNATTKENTTMQIWLGKQYLDQADKQEDTTKMQELKVVFRDATEDDRPTAPSEEVSEE